MYIYISRESVVAHPIINKINVINYLLSKSETSASIGERLPLV